MAKLKLVKKAKKKLKLIKKPVKKVNRKNVA
jgi:hypothetical protein